MGEPSGRMRRVLHVCESTEGGVGVFIESLAAHQASLGHEVTVAVPSGGPVVGRLPSLGVTHAPWEAVAAPGPRVPAELRSLAAIVRRCDPDVVHLHSSKAGLVGRLLLRGRRPTVMQPHAWSFFAKTGRVRAATLAWERYAARWATVVLCVSEDEVQLGRAEGVEARYRVAPNGVDLTRFPPPRPQWRTEARERLDLGPGPLAVCVGRLHRQKNQGALLDVWPAVRDRVPDARLVLVGDGQDRGELEARGVEGVVFAGQQADVRPWLQAATLVCQPSRWEGMSLAVLEAMAAGRSVVATDVPGMREVVDGAGKLVLAGDPGALTDALVERLADEDRADAEGAVARERVERDHDRAHQFANIDAMYEEIAPTRRRLRVLVVQPYAERGGSESWLLRLIDATDQLDLSFVLLKDGPMRGELERRGIPVRLHPVGNNPLDLLPPIAWLTRSLRRERPDVVLGNVLKAQMVAAPAGRLAGVPTVWAKHDHGYDRVLAVPVGKLSTKVIGAVEELAAPARRADAVIIPPPLPDQPPAERGAAREFLAGRGVDLGDWPGLVMAGRLVPFKGVDDAIQALARPAARDWHLYVAGEDDHSSPGETARLQGIADREGVADRVHFLGHVPDVSHWFAAFDALAVLTRPGARRAPGSEGFGTSAFEAMLAGLPVIATGTGAVTRRLDGDRAGAAVPTSDPDAVAAALGRFADPAAREAAGKVALSAVAGHPDAAECARLLVAVLRDAAAAKPA